MALSNREFYLQHALLSAERIEQLLDIEDAARAALDAAYPDENCLVEAIYGIEEDAETPGEVDMCKKIRRAHDEFQGLLSSRVAAMSEALDVVPLQ